MLFGFVYYQTTNNGETPETLITKSDRPSILVLPFKNLSTSENEFVASGITDTLISTLSNYEQLLVQSRNTSDFVSKNKFSDNLVLKRISPIHTNNGNAVSVHDDEAPHIVVAIASPTGLEVNKIIPIEDTPTILMATHIPDPKKNSKTLIKKNANKISIMLVNYS